MGGEIIPAKDFSSTGDFRLRAFGSVLKDNGDSGAPGGGASVEWENRFNGDWRGWKIQGGYNGKGDASYNVEGYAPVDLRFKDAEDTPFLPRLGVEASGRRVGNLRDNFVGLSIVSTDRDISKKLSPSALEWNYDATKHRFDGVRLSLGYGGTRGADRIVGGSAKLTYVHQGPLGEVGVGGFATVGKQKDDGGVAVATGGYVEGFLRTSVPSLSLGLRADFAFHAGETSPLRSAVVGQGFVQWSLADLVSSR